MTFKVEVLPQYQNVVLVTFYDEMTGQDVSQAVAEVIKLASEMPRPCFQIGDFRSATGTFRSVLQITQTFPAMWRIYADEHITGPIVVNDLNNRWLRLSSQLAKTMRLKVFMSFATLEDAIDYIGEDVLPNNRQ